MKAPFEQLRIGETSGLIKLSSLEQLQLAIDQLASQANHRIYIFSTELEKVLFSRQSLIDAITANCKSNRQFSVQVLTKQTNPRAFDGHHLVELQRRLSSFINIRLLAEDFADVQHEYLIADRIAIVDPDPIRPTHGRCDFFSTTRAQALSREFETMWELSTPHQEAKRLHL